MNHFSRINVFMADGNIVLTQEVPAYTVSMLISDIGGQLGVWLGMSVLTTSETLALVGQLLRHGCRRLLSERRLPAENVDGTLSV